MFMGHSYGALITINVLNQLNVFTLHGELID